MAIGWGKGRAFPGRQKTRKRDRDGMIAERAGRGTERSSWSNAREYGRDLMEDM